MARILTGLESTAERLYFLVAEKLKDGDARLNYEQLADELGMSRPSVTYNMRKLKKAGKVGTRNGKHYLMKRANK